MRTAKPLGLLLTMQSSVLGARHYFHVFRVHARAIVTCMMDYFPLGDWAMLQFVAKAMGHFSEAITFYPFRTKPYDYSTVATLKKNSRPLPTGIRKYFVMPAKVLCETLFLKTCRASRMSVFLQKIVHGLCATAVLLAQFWGVVTRLVVRNEAMFCRFVK